MILTHKNKTKTKGPNQKSYKTPQNNQTSRHLHKVQIGFIIDKFETSNI